MNWPAAYSWMRLACEPVGYAHDSWLDAEVLATRSLDAGRPARQAANRRLLTRWQLPDLTAQDAEAPGAGLAVMKDSVLDTLVGAQALVLCDQERIPGRYTSDLDAEAARALAARLRDVRMPTRALLVATQDPLERYRCALAASRFRLHRATQTLKPALAKRWLLRVPRDLAQRETTGLRAEDATWMAKCEVEVLAHYGGWGHVPCL